MKNKLALSFAVFFLALLAGKAQQRLQTSQYMLDNYLLNPAFGGKEETTDFHLGYRNQWVGLADAPKTLFLTAQGKFGLGNTSLASRGRILSTEKKRKLTHGWGLNVGSDKFGPTTYNSFFVSYAVHIPISKKLFASLGISPGIVDYSIDGSKLNLPDKSIDNSITLQQWNKVKPDLNIGGAVYGKNFYAALAATQLLQNQVFTDAIGLERSMRIHYNFTSGMHFKYTVYTLAPSFLIKYVSGAPIAVDLNLRVIYKEIGWIGISYRIQDAVVAMLGFNINKSLFFGYSYDYTTSSLATVSHGTHELMVGYKLARKSTPQSVSSF